MEDVLKAGNNDAVNVPNGFGRDEFLALMCSLNDMLVNRRRRNAYITDETRSEIITQDKILKAKVDSDLLAFENSIEWVNKRNANT